MDAADALTVIPRSRSTARVSRRVISSLVSFVADGALPDGVVLSDNSPRIVSDDDVSIMSDDASLLLLSLSFPRW